MTLNTKKGSWLAAGMCPIKSLNIRKYEVGPQLPWKKGLETGKSFKTTNAHMEAVCYLQISIAMKKAKVLGILKVHIFSDALDLINAISGVKDKWSKRLRCAIKNLVDDIWDVSCFFKQTDLFLIFLENSMGLLIFFLNLVRGKGWVGWIFP